MSKELIAKYGLKIHVSISYYLEIILYVNVSCPLVRKVQTKVRTNIIVCEDVLNYGGILSDVVLSANIFTASYYVQSTLSNCPINSLAFCGTVLDKVKFVFAG